MISKSLQLWKDDTGQDIAEYAVMLAVILGYLVPSIRSLKDPASSGSISMQVRFAKRRRRISVAKPGPGPTSSTFAPRSTPPAKINTSHEAAYVVGVDLGSFYLRVVATDILGNLVYKLRTETRIQRRTPAQ